MNLKLKTTEVFQRNLESNKRVKLNIGGSRSSKTYSLCQLLVVGCYEKQGEVHSIVRKTLPSLKMTVMRDFFEVLNNLGIYDRKYHNKSDHTYELNGNLIEFLSMDQPQKKRGAKRDKLWLNEANELTLEDWRQLIMRTKGDVFLDFNPSDEFHWIYDEVMTREDVEVIQSTYKDNPFLEPEIVTEIERFRELDPDFWRVYGLGERGKNNALIFRVWEINDQIPEDAVLRRGMDFGFSQDPTAVIDVWETEDARWLDERLYATGLTSADMVQAMQDLDFRQEIMCDSSEPRTIKELRLKGVNAKAVKKFPNSVNAGIDLLKSKKLCVTSRSSNLIKELRNYKWKTDTSGNILNTPIDLHNHGIDAARYAILKKKKDGKYHFG